jgi:hypothetical protein
LGTDAHHPTATAAIEKPSVYGKGQVGIKVGKAIGTLLAKILQVLAPTGDEHGLKQFRTTAHCFSKANESGYVGLDTLNRAATSINFFDVDTRGEVI